MFSKATANFVRQIDPEGSLIHVSRINDSPKLVPMALVVKRNRIWFWQRQKYHPTDFTLSDLLEGDKVLSPGVSETEFLSYTGTYRDSVYGRLDTEAYNVNATVEGQGSFRLQSSFDKLKKEELDVKKLLHDSSDRHVDMQHVLVQQLKKGAEVLAVVKERILTTNSCSVTQTKKEQCTFQGMLKLAGLLGSSVKVCVKDRNDIEADSDVSLEIPSGTVIAYSILELTIKKNGHYGICLQPGTSGGIEADSTVKHDDSSDDIDGRCRAEDVPEEVPLSVLLKGSQERDLSPLAELPQSTQCALFKGLQEILRDRTALSYLQDVLEDLCRGESPGVAEHTEQSESQRTSEPVVLECLGISSPTKNSSCAPLNAAHLLVSAMEVLPDETLSFLSESRADFLEAFDTLMHRFRESSESLSIQCLPALLQENQAFQLAEQLLSSTGVMLRRDAGGLWLETGSRAGFHLLVLCISTHGLSLLCKGLK